MSYQIFNEDCLEGMKHLPDGSVDMILDDLPFGTTDLDVDIRLSMKEMWEQFWRVTKHNAAIVLFSQMPFGSDLIQAARKFFRYEITYQKALPVGYLNSHKMPMRIHENILVFYRMLPTYNPQFTEWGKPYKREGGIIATSNYSQQNKTAIDSDGRKYPVDILKAKQPFVSGEKSFHPQQKPVELLEYLIRTYTNEGETVLDATMGSGSTGVACVNTGRNFIGFELNREYFLMSKGRIEEALNQRENLAVKLNSAEIKIVEKSAAELIPYENNPRFNDNAVDAVAKSIETFGFKNPIVIDSANVIICGHTRYKAAQKLGLEKVPCVIADDLSEEQIRAFRIIDNKTGELATWAINDLNDELAALTDFDMGSFGFDTSAIAGVDISPDNFGEDFSLPTTSNAEREEFQITALFHKKQSKLIRKAFEQVGEPAETFGNTNRMGNLLYEIVREWREFKT